jgi:hypothetical protein
MPTLTLGVIEIPYEQKAEDVQHKIPRPHITKKGKLSKVSARAAARAYQSPWRHGESGGQDTGTVAEFLEARYGVMATFYELHEDEIAQALAETYNKKVEMLLSGAPAEQVLEQPFIDPIAVLFNQFIDNREMDGRLGVPTKASLEGKSSRFKAGRGPKPRVSFYDTGNFEGSMRAWIDDANGS